MPKSGRDEDVSDEKLDLKRGNRLSVEQRFLTGVPPRHTNAPRAYEVFKKKKNVRIMTRCTRSHQSMYWPLGLKLVEEEDLCLLKVH